MFEDIKPPGKKFNLSPTKRQPMRSLRLRGHSMNVAKARLGMTKASENEFDNVSDQSAPSPAGKPKKIQWWHRLDRKQKIILSLVSVAVMSGLIGGILVLFPHKRAGAPTQQALPAAQAEESPKPATVASPLTGVQVSPELAARPVTGIMIENSPDARPQSGIQDAGVVFEAIAEGGITRFMTLYQDSRPQYVGPVRSLRPYYLDFAVPFQASIAHVGGSPDALAQVRAGLRDVDQFFNAGSYWRVNSRYAPHNVYTSFDKMDALNKQKGYTSSQFTPWKRKEDAKLTTPTATKIDISISSALYNSHYDYHAPSNTYLRFEGGKPHMATSSEADKAGLQLHPKAIVVLVMTYSVIDKAGHSGYGVTGSGPLFVFQDGGAVTGTWAKASRTAQFEFKDDSGKPIELNTGQVWVPVVSNRSAVKFSP